MFPLPNQLGLGSTTIPEIPASETAASFNFNVSSKARNLIQQIAISKNKETMMPLLNQLLRDRTINNKLKNHILSSLQERDINVVRQRFKQLAVDLHQPAPPTFDVGDGPSLPVVPASETPSSFNAEVSEPQPIVEAQAKKSHLIAPEPLRPRVRQQGPIQPVQMSDLDEVMTREERIESQRRSAQIKPKDHQVHASVDPSTLSWSDRRNWKAKYEALGVETDQHGNARIPIPEEERGRVFNAGPSAIRRAIEKRKAFHAELGILTDDQGYPIDDPTKEALAAGGSVDNSTQAVAAGGPIKKSYIIGGVVLLSAIGGYFIWKNRQS